MRLAVRSLVSVATLAIAACTAHASLTNINFATPQSTNPAPGSYTPTGDNSATTPQTFSAYTEYSYIITPVSGFDYNPNQGSPLPDITGGSPISSTGTSSFTIAGPDGIMFTSFSAMVLGSGAATYEILGNGTVNIGSGSLTTGSSTYFTYDSTTPNTEYSTVELVVTDTTGTVQIDNLAVSAAPEPSSLFLLGTGLVGLGAIARRRFAL